MTVPVIDVRHDVDNRTLTIVAQFTAVPARIWQVYADARQLEKVWGPPSYPATVVAHDLTPGGRVTYVMTSPEGTEHPGYWHVLEVDEPTSLVFEDGIAHPDFTPDPAMPASTNRYSFAAHDGGTRAVYLSTYPTAEALATALEMGVVEGTASAIDQIDDLTEEPCAS